MVTFIFNGKLVDEYVRIHPDLHEQWASGGVRNDLAYVRIYHLVIYAYTNLGMCIVQLFSYSLSLQYIRYSHYAHAFINKPL